MKAAELHEGEPQWKSLRAMFACICLLMLLVFLVASFQLGQRRDMDTIIPEGVDRYAVAMSIAISDLYYGAGNQYVGYPIVLDTVARYGFTKSPLYLDPLGLTYPLAQQNPALINRAIEAATKIDPARVQPPAKPLGWQTAYYQDLGLIDYIKAAFLLFGPGVQSLYYCFWAFFGVSTLFAFLAYWNRPASLSIIVLCVGSFYLLLHAHAFSSLELGSVTNGRFLSGLGMVPLVHLLLAGMNRNRLTLSGVCLAVGQTGILFFAVTIRASAMWMVMAIFLIGVFYLLLALRHGGISSLNRSGTYRRSWPAGLMAAGFLLLWFYRMIAIHPVYYYQDHYLPHHVFWHSLYVGLAYHPEWSERYGAVHKYASGDRLPMEAILWRTQKPEAFFKSPGTGDWRWRLRERETRKAFMQVVKEAPLMVVEVFLIYKPIAFVETMGAYCASIFRALHIGEWLALLCGLFILATGTALFGGIGFTQFLLPGAFVLSFGSTPAFVGSPYAPWTLTDQAWLLMLIICLVLFFLMVGGLRRAVGRR